MKAMKKITIEKCKNVIIDAEMINMKKTELKITGCENVTLTDAISNDSDDFDMFDDFNRYADDKNTIAEFNFNHDDDYTPDDLHEDFVSIMNAEHPGLSHETILSIADNIVDLGFRPDVFQATLDFFEIDINKFNEPLKKFESTASLIITIIRAMSNPNADERAVRAMLSPLEKENMENADDDTLSEHNISQKPIAKNNPVCDITMNTSSKYIAIKLDCIDRIVDILGTHQMKHLVRVYINKLVDIIDLRALPYVERNITKINEYLNTNKIDPQDPNICNIINWVVGLFYAIYPTEVFSKNPLLRVSLPEYIEKIYECQDAKFPKTYFMVSIKELNEFLYTTTNNAIAYIMRTGLGMVNVRSKIIETNLELMRLYKVNLNHQGIENFIECHNFTMVVPDKVVLIYDLYNVKFPGIPRDKLEEVVSRHLNDDENSQSSKLTLKEATRYSTPEEFEAKYKNK